MIFSTLFSPLFFPLSSCSSSWLSLRKNSTYLHLTWNEKALCISHFSILSDKCFCVVSCPVCCSRYVIADCSQDTWTVVRNYRTDAVTCILQITKSRQINCNMCYRTVLCAIAISGKFHFMESVIWCWENSNANTIINLHK